MTKRYIYTDLEVAALKGALPAHRVPEEPPRAVALRAHGVWVIPDRPWAWADRDALFLDALGTGYEAALDGRPALEDAHLRVYRYTPHAPDDRSQLDTAIDYSRGLRVRLVNDDTYEYGHLIERIRRDPDTGEAVVRETWDYSPQVGVPRVRVHAREYMREDGGAVRAPDRMKTYGAFEGMRASGRARSNIITEIKAETMGAIALLQAAGRVPGDSPVPLGVAFIATHSASISAFLESSNPAVYGAWAADTTAWLDMVANSPTMGAATVREWILSRVNIWGF